MSHTKPTVNEQSAASVAQNIYGLSEIVEVKELISYYDRNYYIKTVGSQANRNEFVLKVLNSIDSQYPESILGEIEAMEFLRSKGFPCPQVYDVKNNKAERMALVDLSDSCINTDTCLNENSVYIVRLIAFLKGIQGSSIDRNPEFMYTVGKFVGSLSKHLKDFSHRGISLRTSQRFKWNILEFLDIKEYINAFSENDEESKLIHQVHDAFMIKVKPHLDAFRTGTVHNDINGENILLTPPPYKITGIFDFGDLVTSVLISEITNCMAFFMKGARGIEFSSHILAGYQSVFPLPANERELLYYFLLARLCQLVMYTKANLNQDPNQADSQDCLGKYYGILQDVWGKTKDQVEQIWRKAEIETMS